MKRWTEEQLRASVDGYLSMRERLLNGTKVNKALVFRELADAHGKDYAAWARRFGNISQVMNELGYQPIAGIKPLANVGTNVSNSLAFMIKSRISAEVDALEDSLIKHEADESFEGTVSQIGFSPIEAVDERTRILKSIVLRRGQTEFRFALMKAYEGRCAITGCAVEGVLEAAHIFPYLDGQTSDVSNGLLLRADLHTLFDLHLISADPTSMRIEVGPELAGSEYEALSEGHLAERTTDSPAVSRKSLEWHRSRCDW
jgi:5-methylcytosine-specific restriction protein A